MLPNDGEELLDALLFLGYAVEISDDGAITATQASQILRGKAASGTIEWADRSAMFHIRERAYIARLRARVDASGNASGATHGADTVRDEAQEGIANRPQALSVQQKAG